MKVVVIDNYDSFTYNVVQYVGALGAAVEVMDRGQATPDRLAPQAVDAIIIAPGPWSDEAGRQVAGLISALDPGLPLLGINFGHHALALAYGGRLQAIHEVVHGKECQVRHDGQGIFSGLPDPMTVGCYHSAVVDRDGLPPELVVCAHGDDGAVMAVRHRDYPRYGVQFHPESILTPQGPALLEQFLRGAKEAS